MICLDSSAAAKLARREEHSDDLAAWLSRQVDRTLFCSVLLDVELPPRCGGTIRRRWRACHSCWRASTGSSSPRRSERWRLPTPTHRSSLDAIHLATARFLATSTGSVPTFVAYDARLLAAARSDGFPVAEPGLDGNGGW